MIGKITTNIKQIKDHDGELERFLYKELNDDILSKQGRSRPNEQMEVFLFSAHTDDNILVGGMKAVHKDYKNKGIGSQLMRAAESLARERSCHHMMLTTMTIQAEDFYLKQGFQELTRIKNYPFENCDKIYLIKYL
ncbi:hypothetical protein PPL_09156 [Heterostelium album PN500]|uniref:N-acetyltransferase domain-containing protein n=1 Tax=Heterostelium pallidum (strain ATCC 26659 / Pp 5 / PN500) TaxID=670386 RepID=D3BKS4_HETP5|nr:hypothetical protein PPL_09156 [Heterostelium album PN500]EFA78504.1 hypothetical protein PPL_09156 [Heterostelium album PN500]|eukprot:XP_020430628.1 hypothetical protein PPL_09156 [Heterostelium album PN500]